MTFLTGSVPPSPAPVGPPSRRTRAGTAGRRAGWTALAALALWLVFAVVNWLGGGFWWWGGAVPLLPFFATPLLLLAAVAMPLLRRSALPLPERVLIALAAGQVTLVVLHRLLSGRSWTWVVPDLMVPPVLYVLVPLALLAAVPVLMVRRARSTRAAPWWAAALATAALALGLDQAGLTPPWRGGDGPAPAGALHVVSWDTYCWDTTDDPARFLRYLKKWDADVYLLQEHAGCAPGALAPIEDGERLRREFPGHHVATADGLLTISRFPIAVRTPVGTNPNPYAANWTRAALRTDLRVGGELISMYNVHFYDALYLSSSPLTWRFHQTIKTLDAERDRQFQALAADVAANPNPVLVSGNLNTLPGMGHLRSLDGLDDAARAGGPLYPATLSFAGLRLWRMDWTFTSPGMRVHRYDLRSPEGMSSHHLQDLVVSPAADDHPAPAPTTDPHDPDVSKAS
jgi:endonuclease/exonuclease/phosphatase (EEP) superfamily protein YafD